MSIKGIDVSSYQGETYNTDGVSFVFVKATEGTSYINPKMVKQAAYARSKGLVVGFYHFLVPGDMKAQARYFVEKCDSQPGDPLWADWEHSGVSCAQKDEFIREVKRLRGSNHKVGLYCNTSYWLTRDTTSYAGDALWIAVYNGSPGKPGIKAPFKFHQYTDRPVDTNWADFKSLAELRAWATGGSAKPQYEPFPGVEFFKRQPKSPIVTAMGKRLVAEGCSAYKEGPGPQWTDADKASYARWQRKLGFTGADADGWPGKTSWDKLKVPKV